MHTFYLDFIRVYNEGTLNLARDFGVSERFWDFRKTLDALKRLNF